MWDIPPLNICLPPVTCFPEIATANIGPQLGLWFRIMRLLFVVINRVIRVKAGSIRSGIELGVRVGVSVWDKAG